jgi:hypothetical protein
LQLQQNIIEKQETERGIAAELHGSCRRVRTADPIIDMKEIKE